MYKLIHILQGTIKTCLTLLIILIIMVSLNLLRFGTNQITGLRPIFLGFYLLSLLLSIITYFLYPQLLQNCKDKLYKLIASDKFYNITLWLMLLFYIDAVLCSHYSFITASHDLSMIDEAIYNTYNGNFMYSSILKTNFFAEHFSPILIFLVPFHYIFQNPVFLLITQAVILWCSGIVLRKILIFETNSNFISNLVFILYLNNEITIKTLLYLFHMECFIPLLIFTTYLYYIQKKWHLYTLAFFLSLLIKEDMSIYMIGFSMFIFLKDKQYLAGSLSALVCLIWNFLSLKVFIPFFSQNSYIISTEFNYKFISRWEYWGKTPLDILFGFITKPIDFISYIFNKSVCNFFIQTLFMQFTNKFGITLIALPWIINSTSMLRDQSNLNGYYGIALLTFSIISIIQTLKNFFYFKPNNNLIIIIIVLSISLNISFLNFKRVEFDEIKFHNLLRNIPENVNVQVMPNIYPHLKYNVKKELLMPDSVLNSDMAIFFIAIDVRTWPFSPYILLKKINEALNSKKYNILLNSNKFLILKKIN